MYYHFSAHFLHNFCCLCGKFAGNTCRSHFFRHSSHAPTTSIPHDSASIHFFKSNYGMFSSRFSYETEPLPGPSHPLSTGNPVHDAKRICCPDVHRKRKPSSFPRPTFRYAFKHTNFDPDGAPSTTTRKEAEVMLARGLLLGLTLWVPSLKRPHQM